MSPTTGTCDPDGCRQSLILCVRARIAVEDAGASVTRAQERRRGATTVYDRALAALPEKA